MADVDINKFRASVVREGSKPASPGFIVSEGQSPTDPAGSGQNHLPVTIATAATGLSITESQVLGGAGTVGQYIRGDGSLADFPESSGGGSSVSYYLNGSVAQGTIGGVAYKELNKVPILGAGTDFTINANGYIASFLTDAGDPNLLEIPGGNWNFETYFSASSGGGSPTFYVELYKYDGSTFTLIASSSSVPELIAFGTTTTPYFSSLAVPTTVLALTDRLAVRYYVTHSGRTITLHTEDNHLCQIVTTFTTGITALNGLTAQIQNFAVGTSGTDFNIASATATHTFNLPTASATNRGALSSADWTTFNNKTSNVGTVTSVAALTLGTSGTDLSSTVANGTTTPVITLNVPDASASARGVVTTGAQTIAGAKTLTSPLNGTTSIFSSAFASNQTSKIGIGFESGYGLINAWGADASTFAGLKFQISESDGNTYDAIRINPDGTLYVPAGGYISILEAATLRVGSANAQSQALTPPVAKFINSANNFVKIALGQGETSPNFNDYYGIIALDNNVNLDDNKLRFYLGYDDAVNPTHSNDQLVIQGDGNVGIGTANPEGKLTIAGTSAQPPTSGTTANSLLQLKGSLSNELNLGSNTVDGNYGAYIQASDNNLAVPYQLNLQPTGGNVIIGSYTDNGARLQVSGTQTIGGVTLPFLDFKTTATTGAGFQYKQISYSDATNTELWNIGFNYPNLQFLVGGTRVASFTPSGNVGIGTASPSTFLHVFGSNTANRGQLSIQSNNASNAAKVTWYYDTTNQGEIGTTSGDFYAWALNNFLFYAGGNPRMTITSNGNVLIGVTTDDAVGGITIRPTGTTMVFNNFNTAPTIMSFQYNGAVAGSITRDTTNTSFNTSSDYRLKTDLKDFNGIDLLNKIKTYDFAWKSNNKRMFGVVAHELQEVIEYAVVGNKDGENTQQVDYSKLVPIMVKAIQELKQEIDTLKN